MSPERIQLRRTKGWRKPEGAIVVARPSKWGNPFRVRRNKVVEMPGRIWRDGDKLIVVSLNRWGREDGGQWGAWPNTEAGMRDARAWAVEIYRRTLEASHVGPDGGERRAFYLGKLRGHDLACWCPLDQPCHADVLLELANPKEATDA